jgi:hypothetical protein
MPVDVPPVTVPVLLSCPAPPPPPCRSTSTPLEIDEAPPALPSLPVVPPVPPVPTTIVRVSPGVTSIVP